MKALRRGTLTALDLSSNSIAEMPRAVSRLRALRSLNLACNKLTKLPAAIGACAAAPHNGGDSPRAATRNKKRLALSLF